MKSAKRVAKKYIEYLEAGNISGIISLFTNKGIVHSPVYGTQTATNFYNALSEDTDNSKLTLKGIFTEKDANRLVLYFNYHWTLKNRKQVNFDVIDILVFDNNNKIVELKIIYDTVQTRQLIDDLKKS